MRDGFVKVAAVTPKIRVADTKYNAGVIVEGIREAAVAGAKVIVLPELVITGYRGGDSRGGRHPFCRSTACVQRKTL